MTTTYALAALSGLLALIGLLAIALVIASARITRRREGQS